MLLWTTFQPFNSNSPWIRQLSRSCHPSSFYEILFHAPSLNLHAHRILLQIAPITLWYRIRNLSTVGGGRKRIKLLTQIINWRNILAFVRPTNTLVNGPGREGGVLFSICSASRLACQYNEEEVSQQPAVMGIEFEAYCWGLIQSHAVWASFSLSHCWSHSLNYPSERKIIVKRLPVQLTPPKPPYTRPIVPPPFLLPKIPIEPFLPRNETQRPFTHDGLETQEILTTSEHVVSFPIEANMRR